MNIPETKIKNASETLAVGDRQDGGAAIIDTQYYETEITVQPPQKQTEYGGRTGPDPTRYGDWESKGRCVDF